MRGSGKTNCQTWRGHCYASKGGACGARRGELPGRRNPRCCSERKLQAVQRFLPGYDIIASRLDFSAWKRMKNLAGNLKPLIYGAFPVWRNCTVRAHICNLGASEWRKRKNGVEYARTLRCELHPENLHPRHAPDAGKRRRKDGKFHGADDVKTKERRRG